VAPALLGEIMGNNNPWALAMKRSLWLQEIADELTPTAPLREDLSVDVAIIGGGFVGLWTALRLLELEAR